MCSYHLYLRFSIRLFWHIGRSFYISPFTFDLPSVNFLCSYQEHSFAIRTIPLFCIRIRRFLLAYLSFFWINQSRNCSCTLEADREYVCACAHTIYFFRINQSYNCSCISRATAVSWLCVHMCTQTLDLPTRYGVATISRLLKNYSSCQRCEKKEKDYL